MQYIILFALLAAFLIGEQIKKKRDRQEDENVIFMDDEKKKRRSFDIKINAKAIFGVLLVIIILVVISTSFFTVDQTEYAVLTTFGRPTENIVESGLKFKLPYPIQRVHILSKETFSLTIGYEEQGQGLEIQESESKMITGDENIILADLEVQWKIVDPISYLYRTNDPEQILYNATSSSLRNVIGSSTVDDALTDGRAAIINDIRDNLVKLVDLYDLGISIINVNLQDVDLPTTEVDAAFKAVTDAREERITKINEANKYRNEKINQVEGEKAAILSRAEGEKITLTEKAIGDVARFNAIYSEYQVNEQVTRDRLNIEAIQSAFKEAKIMIVDDNGNTVKYLPIDTLRNNASEKGVEGNE